MFIRKFLPNLQKENKDVKFVGNARAAIKLSLREVETRCYRFSEITVQEQYEVTS